MIFITPFYQQGNVVLLPFPSTDGKSVKTRPAVIINTDWFFCLRGDYIIAAITSQSCRDCFDLPLKDWKSAGLLFPSVVRIGKYLTVHPKVIIGKIGNLAVLDKAEVLKKISWPFN